MRARLAGATIVLASLTAGSPALRAQESPGPEVPAAQTSDARDAALDAEAARIGNTLRCPVCRQQSVTESPSDLAREMLSLIREKLGAGETPEEIEAYFVASYGEWILLQPRARGANLLVYLLPVAAFLLGGFFVVRWLRRGGLAAGDEGGATVATTEGSPPSSEGVEDADRAWLDAAIRGGS